MTIPTRTNQKTRYALDDIAKVMSIHPRTILRALSGVENTYWAPDHDPELDLVQVALAYDMDFDILMEVMSGRDSLMKPAEAAKYLTETYGKDISLRMVRARAYTPVVSKPKVVRYSRLKISGQHFNHYEK